MPSSLAVTLPQFGAIGRWQNLQAQLPQRPCHALQRSAGSAVARRRVIVRAAVEAPEKKEAAVVKVQPEEVKALVSGLFDTVLAETDVAKAMAAVKAFKQDVKDRYGCSLEVKVDYEPGMVEVKAKSPTWKFKEERMCLQTMAACKDCEDSSDEDSDSEDEDCK